MLNTSDSDFSILIADPSTINVHHFTSLVETFAQTLLKSVYILYAEFTFYYSVHLLSASGANSYLQELHGLASTFEILWCFVTEVPETFSLSFLANCIHSVIFFVNSVFLLNALCTFTASLLFLQQLFTVNWTAVLLFLYSVFVLWNCKGPCAVLFFCWLCIWYKLSSCKASAHLCLLVI